MNKITYKPKDLINKKITNEEIVSAEFGRTYDAYICFTCEDDSRIMLHGGEPYDPNPNLEDMRKINFFSPEEIGAKLEQIERDKRRREQERINQKKRELERLKKELGEI